MITISPNLKNQNIVSLQQKTMNGQYEIINLSSFINEIFNPLLITTKPSWMIVFERDVLSDKEEYWRVLNTLLDDVTHCETSRSVISFSLSHIPNLKELDAVHIQEFNYAFIVAQFESMTFSIAAFCSIYKLGLNSSKYWNCLPDLFSYFAAIDMTHLFWLALDKAFSHVHLTGAKELIVHCFDNMSIDQHKLEMNQRAYVMKELAKRNNETTFFDYHSWFRINEEKSIREGYVKIKTATIKEIRDEAKPFSSSELVYNMFICYLLNNATIDVAELFHNQFEQAGYMPEFLKSSLMNECIFILSDILSAKRTRIHVESIDVNKKLVALINRNAPNFMRTIKLPHFYYAEEFALLIAGPYCSSENPMNLTEIYSSKGNLVKSVKFPDVHGNLTTLISPVHWLAHYTNKFKKERDEQIASSEKFFYEDNESKAGHHYSKWMVRFFSNFRYSNLVFEEMFAPPTPWNFARQNNGRIVYTNHLVFAKTLEEYDPKKYHHAQQERNKQQEIERIRQARLKKIAERAIRYEALRSIEMKKSSKLRFKQWRKIFAVRCSRKLLRTPLLTSEHIRFMKVRASDV